MIQTQFTLNERVAICRWLGESPFTVITIHQIRQGTVNMVLVGSLSDIRALVVQSHDLMEEPNAFGHDANAILDGLSIISDWSCVNVSRNVADELADLMADALQCSVRLYGDVHFVLDGELTCDNETHIDAELRLLTANDIPNLENAPHELLTSSTRDYVAGAIVDNQIIALAHAHALSDTFADVGVYTDEAWRNRGISTQLSYIVMQRLQSHGYVPVWSTGEDNRASQRVAEKLNMTFYGSRVYLILEEND